MSHARSDVLEYAWLAQLLARAPRLLDAELGEWRIAPPLLTLEHVEQRLTVPHHVQLRHTCFLSHNDLEDVNDDSFGTRHEFPIFAGKPMWLRMRI